MKVIDGKKISETILNTCKTKLRKLSRKPKLSIIIVGNNPASLTYINKKKQAGEYVGIDVEVYHFDKATFGEIEELITRLNNDSSVTGIIIQLPLPDLDSYEICRLIAPSKDVDGLNPINLGNLWLNQDNELIPATVKAIEYVLKFIATDLNLNYKEYISGKNILIINKSVIIGKPLAALMAMQDATVILAHSKTQGIGELMRFADIIVTATGQENFINNQVFKKGVVIIDVGYNKTAKRIFGDVGSEINTDYISYLTPVPGGIGPIGVACLIENVIDASF